MIYLSSYYAPTFVFLPLPLTLPLTLLFLLLFFFFFFFFHYTRSRSPVDNSSSPFAWPQNHSHLASATPQAPSPLQQALPAKLNGSVKGNSEIYRMSRRMSHRMSHRMSDHEGS